MLKNITFNSLLSKLPSLISQLVVFSALFYGISWWQQKDMLSTGSKLTTSDLSLISTKGNVFQYQFNNDNNDTLIYFFAPWCTICHLSIDNLEDLYRSKPEKLNILVVALDWSSLTEVDEFLAQHELTMPVLLGTEKVRQNFQISAFPSYYLISKHAEIKAKNLGYSTKLGMDFRLLTN